MAPPESIKDLLDTRPAACLPTEAPPTAIRTHHMHNHQLHLNSATKQEVHVSTQMDNGHLPLPGHTPREVSELGPGERSALQCGVSALQSCGTIRAYTLVLAVNYLAIIAVTTYVIGSYRTLEKRFNLSSRDIAALNTITDAVQVVSVLFVGYFGRNAHKPRVISISVLFCVLGALLYATPYFIYGSKEDMDIPSNSTAGTSLHMCTADHSESLSVADSGVSAASAASAADRTAYVIVALACICLGVGGSCIRVMGFVYIDENVRAQDTPLYVGLAGAVIPLGPILGFLLAAICTGIPENLIGSQLSPEHPAYIGAWWLGFIIIGALVLVSGVPMFLFPKHLPYYYSTKQDLQGHKGPQPGQLSPQVRALGPQTGPSGPHPEVIVQSCQQKTQGASKEPINEKLQLIGVEVKGFMRSLVQLVCNGTLVVFTLHSVFDILVVMGMAGNMTRYLEVQFNMPAFKANIVTAVSVAVPGVLGNVAGGVIMKRYNLGMIGASVINTVASAALIITLAIPMGLGCEQINVAGNFDQVSNMLDVGLGCNSNCSCVANTFLPVCVDNSINYLTACHAGCTTAANQTHFTDCGCVGDKMAAVSGLCSQDCPLVVPYVIMSVLSVFFIALARVPSVVINLRVVQPELKAFSLGIVSFADNLLGFIPAPILFGSLVDSACIVWADVEGSQGACLLYDRDRYRLSVSGTCVGMQVMSFLLAALTWVLVKRDVTAGRYKNIEKEEQPIRDQHTDHPVKAPGGKTNLAFSSLPDDAYTNGHLVDALNDSVSDDLEWETEEAMMDGPFSLREEGRTALRARHQDLSPSLVSLQSRRGQHQEMTSALGGGAGEDWMLTSAMTVAMELMAVTHRYIMDVVQLSGEFSTRVVQHRDLNEVSTNVVQHRDAEFSTNVAQHQDAEFSTNVTQHRDAEFSTNVAQHGDAEFSTNVAQHGDAEFSTNVAQHGDAEFSTNVAQHRDAEFSTNVVQHRDTEVNTIHQIDTKTEKSGNVQSVKTASIHHEHSDERSETAGENTGTVSELRRHAETVTLAAERVSEDHKPHTDISDSVPDRGVVNCGSHIGDNKVDVVSDEPRLKHFCVTGTNMTACCVTEETPSSGCLDSLHIKGIDVTDSKA